MYLLLLIFLITSCQQTSSKNKANSSSSADHADNTVVIEVASDNEVNHDHKAKIDDKIVSDAPIINPPPPPPPFFITDNKPETLFYEEDDDDTCGNNEQDIRSRKTLDCQGLLYGAIEYPCDDDDYCAELIRINENDGSKIFIAPLNLDPSLTTKSIVGIDFDSTGQLEILYQGYLNSDLLSVKQAYVDCHSGVLSSDHEIYRSTGLSFLNPQAQGFSIDAQGLSFTTIVDDFNNDNSNDGTKLALAGVLYPEFLNNVSAQYPMALVDGPFPIPDILNVIEGNNQSNYICSIAKNTRLTACQSIISFNNFPLGFSYDNTKEADQDYATGLNYSIVRDSNISLSPYIAITNVNTYTVVNLFPFTSNDNSNTNLVAIAVNQSYEECDHETNMIGAKCDKHCNIIEVNCNDDMDNDNNGFTDCEDKACTLSVNCR